MKTSLNMNVSQHLTLTPQLQHAIRLLQLSTLELNQEIQQALENNPMLETEELEKAAASENESLGESLNWEDFRAPVSSKSKSDDAPNYEQIVGTTVSLREHLLWQLDLTPFSELDHAIATSIIDSIDDNGFLQESLDGIRESLRIAPEQTFIDIDEVEAVLQRVQRFDPIGCGARDLKESLLIQLSSYNQDNHTVKLTKLLIEQNFTALAEKNYDKLRRLYKLKQEDLYTVLQFMKTLDPRPGSRINVKNAEYIVPDVIVRKKNGVWKVELNQESLPKIRLNHSYVGLVKRADNSPDNTFMRNHLQEARWFLKSLHSRHETLLRVASKIVESQQGFLELGEEAMKPMILNDIAKQLDMHESTVSRITTQKYLYTPRGIFELKYFFSSHVKTDTGGECSSTAICAIIKKLIASELANKPLSDNKIAQIIGAQGIKVARRTVAKYREILRIPPSHERKTLV